MPVFKRTSLSRGLIQTELQADLGWSAQERSIAAGDWKLSRYQGRRLEICAAFPHQRSRGGGIIRALQGQDPKRGTIDRDWPVGAIQAIEVITHQQVVLFCNAAHEGKVDDSVLEI